jgi:hypothetical protein
VFPWLVTVDEYNIQTILSFGNSKMKKNGIFFENAVSGEISKFFLLFAVF